MTSRFGGLESMVMTFPFPRYQVINSHCLMRRMIRCHGSRHGNKKPWDEKQHNSENVQVMKNSGTSKSKSDGSIGKTCRLMLRNFFFRAYPNPQKVAPEQPKNACTDAGFFLLCATFLSLFSAYISSLNNRTQPTLNTWKFHPLTQRNPRTNTNAHFGKQIHLGH